MKLNVDQVLNTDVSPSPRRSRRIARDTVQEATVPAADIVAIPTPDVAIQPPHMSEPEDDAPKSDRMNKVLSLVLGSALFSLASILSGIGFYALLTVAGPTHGSVGVPITDDEHALLVAATEDDFATLNDARKESDGSLEELFESLYGKIEPGDTSSLPDERDEINKELNEQLSILESEVARLEEQLNKTQGELDTANKREEEPSDLEEELRIVTAQLQSAQATIAHLQSQLSGGE